MIHIAFVVPDPALAAVVHKGWALHEQLFGRSQDLKYTVDFGIEPEQILERYYDADVIVSRGGTAAALKERNCLIPVIEIPITSSDMRYSINRAVKKHGKLPIGVVGTINTIRSVYFSKHDYGVSVRPYPTDSVYMGDLVAGMERAVADGCGLILAGHNTCHYCDEHGIPAGLIYSSTESVFLAITEAKRCAGVSQTERENSMIFRSIVENVFEGIVAVDGNNIIRTFNPAAGELIGRDPKKCMGKTAESVLPESRLGAILADKQAYTNEIVRIGGESFVLNSTPMEHEGKHLGTVVTFQAAQIITSAESRLRDRLRASGYVAKYHFGDILGESQAIRTAIHQAKRFAHVDSSILLYGETGTGKELFAQSIHNESERAAGPFVAVNCAAIPENLMESELFGYESGAFTGASKAGKEGLFEAAHQGTIFLDEVSEIPLALQSRLLRVIQEREIRRVGGNRVTPINVRIICATNRSLQNMIDQGRFREDLYYRLNVLSIQLPPMRERHGDIALIMQHYLDHYTLKFNRDRVGVSPEAVQLASAYAWPGNVREIRNKCEQLAVLCEADTISEEDMRSVLPRQPAKVDQAQAIPPPLSDIADNIDEMRRRRLWETIASTPNRAEAAKRLGISKTTLWRRCRELGIHGPGPSFNDDSGKGGM